MSRDTIRYSRLFPELRLFDTPAERKQAMRRAEKTLTPTWEYGLLVLVAIACAMAMFVTLEAFAAPTWVQGVGCGLAISAPSAAGGWLFRRRIRRSLRQQLIERGVPVCLACGYQLRGQVDPRCPECGAAFDERLLELCRPTDD